MEQKKFESLTTEEINSLSDKEWKSINPLEKKSCEDCEYLTRALSLWCSNDRAISVRGTTIPGCIKCPYWKPNWNYIDKIFWPREKLTELEEKRKEKEVEKEEEFNGLKLIFKFFKSLIK